MPSIVAALIGAAVTLLVVGFVFIVVLAGRRRCEMNARELGPTACESLVKAIQALPVGATVVGPHDELLTSNDAAARISLVKGSRLGFHELLELVREVRREGESYEGEIVHGPVSGSPRLSLRVHATKIAPEQILVVGVDDAQARRLEVVRRDFVANISHELKTPIGAISVLAEAVVAAKDDPEAVERFSVRLQKETVRLSELIRQVIELSRLQSTDLSIEFDLVSLQEIIDDAIERCHELATNRRISLVISPGPNGFVHGNRWQLTDAVTNLVQNAINYSDQGARVTLTIGSNTVDGEDFVELKVSDNGIGISREDQERIFERFYRVDYGRSRSMGGTGLGLSIVRHIMLAHGGTVEVWSNLGQGSTFTLRFPAVGQDEAEVEE